MKCFDERYNDIAKTQLHCHLEGSIRTSTIIDIAREYNIRLPSYEARTLNQHVKVYDQLRDLQSVLNAFAIAQHSFASPAAVERIAFELFEEAQSQNIKLLELRFSPDWAFSGHDLNWDKAFQGILKARERAEKHFDITIGLIAVSSRSMGRESCERTIDWAVRWKDLIHGIDLADGEADHPVDLFVKPVVQAQEAGLKVTVHSGEDTPASAVVDTIKKLGPDRIGHGIHAIEDMDAVELIRTKDITLEVSPWSNYLTNSVKTIEEHPLKQLYDLGVKTTINSDDPEVLDTNLNNEYRIAHEILGMSMADIAVCNRYAVEASFLPEEKKNALRERYFSC